MTKSRYRYYQTNKKDLKDEYGDCVIRSLTKVTGKEWLQVFEELLPYARELQCMPNGKACYEKYLISNKESISFLVSLVSGYCDSFPHILSK